MTTTSPHLHSAVDAASRLDDTSLRIAIHALSQMATKPELFAPLSALCGALGSLAAEDRSAVERVLGLLVDDNSKRTRKGARYSDHELCDALRECAEYFGKPPTVRNYDAWMSRTLTTRANVPHWRTLCERFGRWDDGLTAAGLDPAAKRGRPRSS